MKLAICILLSVIASTCLDAAKVPKKKNYPKSTTQDYDYYDGLLTVTVANDRYESTEAPTRRQLSSTTPTTTTQEPFKPSSNQNADTRYVHTDTYRHHSRNAKEKYNHDDVRPSMYEGGDVINILPRPRYNNDYAASSEQFQHFNQNPYLPPYDSSFPPIREEPFRQQYVAPLYIEPSQYSTHSPLQPNLDVQNSLEYLPYVDSNYAQPSFSNRRFDAAMYQQQQPSTQPPPLSYMYQQQEHTTMRPIPIFNYNDKIYNSHGMPAENQTNFNQQPYNSRFPPQATNVYQPLDDMSWMQQQEMQQAQSRSNLGQQQQVYGDRIIPQGPFFASSRSSSGQNNAGLDKTSEPIVEQSQVAEAAITQSPSRYSQVSETVPQPVRYIPQQQPAQFQQQQQPQQQPQYFPESTAQSQNNYNYQYAKTYAHPVAYQQGPTTEAIPILKQTSDMDIDGSYIYETLTADQTHVIQQGHIENRGTDHEEQVIQGSYSYTGDDGKVYTVTYIADGNGFRATGDHLPTPPPIPEVIQRAIEFNLAEEAAMSAQQQQQSYPQSQQYGQTSSSSNAYPYLQNYQQQQQASNLQYQQAAYAPQHQQHQQIGTTSNPISTPPNNLQQQQQQPQQAKERSSGQNYNFYNQQQQQQNFNR